MLSAALVVGFAVAAGCSKSNENPTSGSAAATQQDAGTAAPENDAIALASANVPIGPPPPKPSAAPPEDATAITVEQLHESIRRANPNYTGLGQFRIQNGQV